ncbi:hypothetical protein G205_09173 [Arthrobacter nitrophenolicus]|uniref:Uncharacterized protein n=1 Tax=Arthrobacter nitrophenolicus TaxID=683150 RepID=L8TSN7_9MICC|nr:hypothetical protein G205_09173 [Arthrobacter nitrophenolicus]
MGETYRVEVPQRLPPELSVPLWAAVDWPALMLLQGCWFELTVLDIEATRAPATVHGIRLLRRTDVVLPLNSAQVAELGLPAGSYEIAGHVRPLDDEAVVSMPAVQTVTMPVRWLHTLASKPSRDHRDASYSGL